MNEIQKLEAFLKKKYGRHVQIDLYYRVSVKGENFKGECASDESFDWAAQCLRAWFEEVHKLTPEQVLEADRETLGMLSIEQKKHYDQFKQQL